MGFSVKQTDRSLTPHCFTGYSVKMNGRTDCSSERRGGKHRCGIGKSNPNLNCVSAWDRLLPSQVDCQLCQGMLGIVREFRLF